jgi:hypothetical protein
LVERSCKQTVWRVQVGKREPALSVIDRRGLIMSALLRYREERSD